MKTLSLTLVAALSSLANQTCHADEIFPASVCDLYCIQDDMSGYNKPALPPIPPPRYAFGGFLSQSWVRTSHDVNISGPSSGDHGSFQRTEVGVFGTYSINRYLDLRGMLSSFKDGQFDNGSIQINYGLLDVHDPDSEYGVRLGWISNSAGFFTDQLNVPQYRDTEIAPQGLYRDAYRHLARGGRGVQAYAKLYDGHGWTVAVEASAFRANVKDQQELAWAFFGNTYGTPTTFEPKSNITTASAKIRNEKLGLVIRYDRNDVHADVTSSPEYNGEQAITIHRFGARKYFQTGDVTIERAAFFFTNCGDAACVHPFGAPVASDITYRRYLTPALNLIVGYDSYYLASGDQNGERTRAEFASAGLPFAAASMYSRSINLGLHWERDNVTYKAEVHHVKGQAALMATENDLNRLNLPTSYNVLMLNVSIGF